MGIDSSFCPVSMDLRDVSGKILEKEYERMFYNLERQNEDGLKEKIKAKNFYKFERKLIKSVLMLQKLWIFFSSFRTGRC